jgi:short-subunit dehydrogenase
VIVTGTRKDALAAVVDQLAKYEVTADYIVSDLQKPDSAREVIRDAERLLGSIDLLVNNAGREMHCAYTACDQEEITTLTAVNLLAPMMLTHAVLPGMLRRNVGYVVFVASLAGKLGAPYSEPYAATKAGLVAFSQSLRAQYRRQNVGFSVVCPGFIADDGMWARWTSRGLRSTRMMGETTSDRTVSRLLDAVRRDLPEVIESGAPIRPLLAIQPYAPRLVERIVYRSGLTELFAECAALSGRAHDTL